MSRNSGSRDVYDVLCERLNHQFVNNKSRNEDKKTGADKDYIYSKKTLQEYKDKTRIYVNWVKQNYPDVNLKKSNIINYVKPFFEAKINEGLSPYSLKTYKSALNRSLKIKEGGKYDVELPTRHRTDIKRSRDISATKKAQEGHFNENNHRDLVDFCKAVGCRRASIPKLTADTFFTMQDLDLASPSKLDEKTAKAMIEAKKLYLNKQGYENFCGFVKLHEKGSKIRFAPILKENYEIVAKVYSEARERGRMAKLFSNAPTNADYHSYRADYSNQIYDKLARPIDQIPYDKTRKIGDKWVKYQSGVYSCRGDMKGIKLDKQACLIVSKALGHNRIEIFASNYLRG